jgi:hypothetical protein
MNVLLKEEWEPQKAMIKRKLRYCICIAQLLLKKNLKKVNFVVKLQNSVIFKSIIKFVCERSYI